MIKKLFNIPGLIALVLIFGIAYLGLWMALRSTVVAGVANYLTELESEGYRVEHGGLSIDGFPFSIAARSPNVSINSKPGFGTSSQSNWSVKTNAVDFYSSTVTPLSWSMTHRGELSVDMRMYGGPRYMFDISPANIDADIAFSLSGKLKSLGTHIPRAQLNPLLGAEPPVLGFGDLHAELIVKGDTGSVNFLAKNIELSQQVLGDVYRVLGQNVSLLSLNGEIENWPLIEVRGLESWLQSPAKIKSENWQILWGSADIVGGFDLGFKNELPEGIIRFRVKNIETFLQSLVEVDLIDSSFASQMNAAAGSIVSDEDGRKSVEITIRNGVVKYGFFTLFKF